MLSQKVRFSWPGSFGKCLNWTVFLFCDRNYFVHIFLLPLVPLFGTSLPFLERRGENFILYMGGRVKRIYLSTEGQTVAETDHVFSKVISFFLLGIKLNYFCQPLLQLGGSTGLSSGRWGVDQVDKCCSQAYYLKYAPQPSMLFFIVPHLLAGCQHLGQD